MSGRDTPAVVDLQGTTSFRELSGRVRELALAISRAGLIGSRIGLSSTADRNWIEAFWAVLLSGNGVVPISPLHPEPERASLLRQSGARAHLVSRSLSNQMSEGAVPRLVFDGGRLLDSPSVSFRPDSPPTAERRPCALLLYTSGTTGQPKGVPLSHENVSANVQTLTDAWAISDTDRVIHALPLHHVHGICVALLTAQCAGATVEFLPRFEPDRVLDAAARSSVLMSVPTQHKRLVDHLDQLTDPEQKAHGIASLRGLRLITSGSAKLPESLGRRIEAWSGQYPLERYGMTEVGIVLGNPLAGPRRPGSCGQPLRGCEIRIVDEQGHDVEGEQPGEIWIGGRSVFAGYDADPAATLAAFESGYFKSGDTARWTSGGFVEILGRTSVDIIKSGGYKLSAIEMEEQLRAHPWVQDVAVVGVPDETWGERAVAVVVVSAEGREVVERAPSDAGEELRNWLKQRVASYQVPKSVVWQADLPRNAMGKVQKPELLKLLLRGE